MKVLFVSEFFYPRAAGGEVWAWELCKGLVKKGHDVTVITLSHDNSPTNQKMAGVRILRPYKAGKSRLKRKIKSILLLRAVKKYLKHNKPDVIHVVAYVMNVQVSKLAKRKGIPCVTAIHSYFGSAWKYISPLAPFLKPLEKRCIKKDSSKIMHVPSDYVKKQIEKDTGKLVRVIRNWAPEKFPKPKNLPETYLFVGSLEPVKNPLACIGVSKGKRLIVIGSGSLEKKMKVQAKNAGVDCEFIPHLHREGTLTYIGGASLVLVPSLSESFSLVALEAVAQGTPVSGNQVGIMPELPTVSFPPKKTPKRLTKKQVRYIRDKFSKEKAIKRIIECYKEAQ